MGTQTSESNVTAQGFPVLLKELEILKIKIIDSNLNSKLLKVTSNLTLFP